MDEKDAIKQTYYFKIRIFQKKIKNTILIIQIIDSTIQTLKSFNINANFIHSTSAIRSTYNNVCIY